MRWKILNGKCIALWLSISFGLMLSSRIWDGWRRWREPVVRWAGIETCPACYGLDACRWMETDDFDLACRGLLAAAAGIFGWKNVLVACTPRRGKVVLKRLGHDWQLEHLDEKFCAPFGSNGACDFDAVPDLSSYLYQMMESLVSYSRLEKLLSDEIGLTMCPSTENLQQIIAPSLKDEESSSALNRILMLNIWTMMNINSEPIVLRFINNQTTGWPVPNDYGACGRIVIQSYEGQMLTDYLSADWLARANIAINLLKAADIFTFDHPNFRFYLTDVSLENIVIKSTKSWQPVFIDMENVIIVDKGGNFSLNYDEWMSNHTSEVIECPGCFAYSSEKICHHYLSDHNHYSICLLLQELNLQNVPDYALKLSPNLIDSISECVLPSAENDRFNAANFLRKELEKIVLAHSRDNKQD